MATARVIHSISRKTDDTEIHVSSLPTKFGDYVDIREYSKSLEQYGRGITFPSRVLDEIFGGLEKAWEFLGLENE